MTDNEFDAKVEELKLRYGNLSDNDEIAAHYTAISHVVGLQTPEDHAAELFLATAAGTWVNAYSFFVKRVLYLVVVQLLALAAGYYYQLSTANLLLLAPALTFGFALVQWAIGTFASIGEKLLHDRRSVPVLEFIERVEERSKEVLEARVEDAKKARKK